MKPYARGVSPQTGSPLLRMQRSLLAFRITVEKAGRMIGSWNVLR